jgi:hypothetical protein
MEIRKSVKENLVVPKLGEMVQGSVHVGPDIIVGDADCLRRARRSRCEEDDGSFRGFRQSLPAGHIGDRPFQGSDGAWDTVTGKCFRKRLESLAEVSSENVRVGRAAEDLFFPCLDV